MAKASPIVDAPSMTTYSELGYAIDNPLVLDVFARLGYGEAEIREALVVCSLDDAASAD